MRRILFLAVVIGAIVVAAFQPARTGDLAAQEVQRNKAAIIAEAWWYTGDGTEKSGKSSSQRTGAGPEDETFFAYSGTVTNLGSYQEAWSFYAKKCGAKETYDAKTRIIGQPSDTKGYYTILQRTDGGKKSTTFARHEKDATITVHLLEAEASPEQTTLLLSVVVVQH